MLHQILDLWAGETYAGELSDGFRPKLTTYIRNARTPRPAVLVLPGGGYGFTSPREAEPIALRFAQAGFAAFVLDYSVSPRRNPQPLHDVALAMAHIRRHAEEYKVDTQRIAVTGFSAGGHLAASLGVHWDKPWARPSCVQPGENQPNALILAYPVISSGTFAHRGSFQNLLGDRCEDTGMLELFSLEKQVGAQTPPTFLWHTVEDGAVPPENSMMFASALRSAGVSFALHMFPWGGHGLSLAVPETSDSPEQNQPVAAAWMQLALDWLEEAFRRS